MALNNSLRAVALSYSCDATGVQFQMPLRPYEGFHTNKRALFTFRFAKKLDFQSTRNFRFPIDDDTAQLRLH